MTTIISKRAAHSTGFLIRIPGRDAYMQIHIRHQARIIFGLFISSTSLSYFLFICLSFSQYQFICLFKSRKLKIIYLPLFSYLYAYCTTFCLLSLYLLVMYNINTYIINLLVCTTRDVVHTGNKGLTINVPKGGDPCQYIIIKCILLCRYLSTYLCTSMNIRA